VPDCFHNFIIVNNPITDLDVLAQQEKIKDQENLDFRSFLVAQDAGEIDKLVQELNAGIAPKIDCTQCGNCCQTLMVNITEPECSRAAEILNMNTDAFKENYVETSLQGRMILNRMPCHFLKDKACSIYEQRFTECRDFPALHRSGFTTRLFGTLMHYGRCPIIYNVVEELKIKTGFLSESR
jgi:uncharacterized protein